MIRKHHTTRLAACNRNLLTNDFNKSAAGNEEKSDDQWRCRQKGSSKKKSSIGARMYSSSHGYRLNSKSKKSLDVSSKNAKFFGPAIPDDVLDDLCFRFLINIPDDQKNIPVRLCFQIELAHWFYIDFYSSRSSSTLKCPQVSLRDLIGQIFNHCDFLIQYADKVDKVLDEWRVYKSGVPTYGAALLDSSLNYVLLVQGYFAKNSWGFPKGKINEEEEATACASREVMEEVGYDISDKISNSRLIQNLVNDTLIRLYIICDVPTDFPFAPKTRNEIGKIQWFSLWNLPKDRNDFAACEQIGMTPSNFYTVIPFVKELQAYVTQLHNGCSKLEHEAADMISFGEHSSAFSPVHPQLFCKPLSTSTLPVSYTGAAFVQMLSSGNLSATFSDKTTKMKVTKPKQTVAPILGRPVYDAFESDLEKRKVITPIRCSFDSSNKVISNKKVLNSLTDKNKEEVNMDHCYHSNSPVLNVISQSSNKSCDMERNCEKELENSITYTHSSIATHHVTDDKSLIHLCDAWKDFRVGKYLSECDL